MAEEREIARKNKDFSKSDELRDKALDLGFKILDKPEGYQIRKV
jgi:cysteinyl-tRNA synthetase